MNELQELLPIVRDAGVIVTLIICLRFTAQFFSRMNGVVDEMHNLTRCISDLTRELDKCPHRRK